MEDRKSEKERVEDNSIDMIVLAAGSGSRMRAGMNKMFLEVGGVPILVRTIRRLCRMAIVKRVVLVTKKDEMEKIRELLDIHRVNGKAIVMIEGGEERSDSVRNGLRYLMNYPECELIMTHDGARPFFSEDLVGRLAMGAGEGRITVPVLPVVETLRRSGPLGKTVVVSRERLFITQTPQAFMMRDVNTCFFSGGIPKQGLTDEASYFEEAGYGVSMVQGERWNIKITDTDDLKWGRYLLTHFGELETREKQLGVT
jgi:2-C-methyl-D-erythritol 4-phosphate cytidylyltransferase